MLSPLRLPVEQLLTSMVSVSTTMLQRDQDPKSPFVFTSEQGSPFTTAGFARMVERAGVEAKLGFKAHPHMLRHACGFALANT
jgi:site-specific recombinase XerD